MKKKIIFFIIFFTLLVTTGGILFIAFPQRMQRQMPFSSTQPSSVIPSFPVTTPTPLPPANQDHAADLNNQYNMTNQPDIFLSNKTPYDTTDFSVTSDFASSPTQHFFFTVTAKNAHAQQAFLTWLHSLGLTDGQIQILDVRYQ